VSTAFSRSLRSLAADDFRASALGLLLVATLLLAWLAWFLFARVPLYEVSTAARLVSESRAIAEFPPAALARIAPSQSAHVRFDGFSAGQDAVIRATVSRVIAGTHGGRVRVLIEIHPATAPAIPLQPGLAGTATIEVEQVTPAELVLRAASGSRRGQ
jgi:hypothetical protein